MQPDRELDLLIERYRDGDLEGEEIEALYQRCREDGMAIQELERQIEMHRALCGIGRRRGDELWLRIRERMADVKPRRRTRTWYQFAFGTVAAAAALVLILLLPTDHEAQTPGVGLTEVARVEHLDGVALLERAGSIEELRMDSALVAGDRIRLQVDARLAVRHQDGSGSVFESDADLRLTPEAGIEIELVHGRVSSHVMPRDASAPMRIRTPHTLVTVLGTRLHIDVDVATRVRVSSGRVQVEDLVNHAPAQIVAAGGDLTVALRPTPDPTIRRQMAFPGALGYGADTIHARGGRTIAVTTLADDGPGSLRAAVAQSGPRFIVFRVAGLIRLRSQLVIREPFCMIAGQTAPAPGICLSGASLRVATHDVVIRHVRSRPGDDPAGQAADQRDGFSIGSPDNEVYNVVLDHCSVSWSQSEGITVWYGSRDVSIQWCLIGEALRNSTHPRGRHSFGLVVGDGARRVSIHHNVFAFNDAQNPMLGGGVGAEIVNNLIVGWGYHGIGIETAGRGAVTADILGNLLMPLPFSSAVSAITTVGPVDVGSHIHVAGNQILHEGVWKGVGLRSLHPSAERRGLSDGLDADPGDLYQTLLTGVGAMRPARDAVDQRLLAQVSGGQGKLIDAVSETPGYDAYIQLVPPAPDADGDGMPDLWETERGLDPSDPADASLDADGDGFTSIETFLSER